MDTVIHKDYLNRPIAVGDAVAYISRGMLNVGVVDKLNPVMIRVVPLSKKDNRYYYTNKKFINIISECAILIPKEDLVWFQLTQ